MPRITKFIDPDFRREPKTDFFCCRCQKDLPREGARFVWLDDTFSTAIHPDHVTSFPHAEKHPIGRECLRLIGAEWLIKEST